MLSQTATVRFRRSLDRSLVLALPGKRNLTPPCASICDLTRWRRWYRPAEIRRHRVRDAAIILLMFRHGLRTAELVRCGGNRLISKSATSMCIGSSAVTTPNILYGARSFACCGNSSARTRTRRMSLCRSARHLCLHAPFARSWRERQAGGTTLRAPSSPTAACMRLLLSLSRA